MLALCKMSFKISLSFIILLCIKIVYSEKPDQLYIYQKDISEHCRRRASPSVFLGRHVISSNSKILHFSRRDIPYSCSLTIRAESGSSIIMMVQLLSEEDLENSCLRHNGQLVVYQMGETFGGYWGPIPDALIQQPGAYQKIYTHKTSTTTKTTLTPSEETNRTTSSTRTQTFKGVTRPEEKYIRFEVPLVNVSVNLVPGEPIIKESDIDQLYDVTPIPGVKYDTSMIPIAQIAVHTVPLSESSRKTPYDRKSAKSSSLMQFTPDVRLSFPDFLNTVTRRKPRIKDYKYNRLSKLKPRRPVHRRGKTRKKPPKSEYHRRMFMGDSMPKKDVSGHSTDSSNFLDKILDLYEKRDNQRKSEDHSDDYKNIAMFLRNITDAKYNYSAYLFPKERDTTQFSLSNTVKKFTLGAVTKLLHPKAFPSNSRIQSLSVRAHDDQDLKVESSISSTPTTKKKTLRTTTLRDIRVTDYHLEFKNTEPEYGTEGISRSTMTDIITTTSASETLVQNIKNHRTTTLSTNLVDHESWENVVQAAPEMAVLLNQAVPMDRKSSSNVTRPMENSTTTEKGIKRLKRFIQVVPIEKARPRQMTTHKYNTTVTESTKFLIPEMQDFAQLVEIQDDEIHGRVALRYIRNYIGVSIYNICDFEVQSKASRSVYLFNTSRIVISLSHFSMERMTIVLTPGRTVIGTNSVCPASHLECQVTGARVCIDSMNACDGLPNCGAYDIYDEDRVRCGRTLGLQHNVALAAFAFVSVLLTSLYAVHYWLKRCVPAVSDAFFIYINGADNILYLETIMRSPTDVIEPDEDDDVSKRVFNSNLLQNFDEDLFKSEHTVKGELKSSLFSSLMRFFRKEKQVANDSKKRSLSDEIMQTEYYTDNTPISFAEHEINKRVIQKDVTDAAIQTSMSLELRELNRIRLLTAAREQPRDSLQLPRTSQVAVQVEKPLLPRVQEMNKVDSEINALRFFRQSKQLSDDSSLMDVLSKSTEEKELRSTSYERKVLIPPSVDTHAKKHLRFDEETTMIANEENKGIGASFMSLAKRKGTRDVADVVEDDGEKDNKMDFRRFWKGKKGYKKKQQSLALR